SRASSSASFLFSISHCTQPAPRLIPYSADRLSPTTRITGVLGDTAFSWAWASCGPTNTHRLIRMDKTRIMDADVVINVSHLKKHVAEATGTLHILDDISFVLERSATLAITGSSGSGKSTLLGILAGLDTPSSGEVSLMGKSIFEMDEDARAVLRAQNIGFVFQSFQLLPNLTALENVMLPLELQGQTARAQAQQMLER